MRYGPMDFTSRPLLLILALLALLAAAPAAAAAPATTVVGPNVLVRPDTIPSGSSAVTLTAARNEFESAQVVVRAAGAPIDNASVQVLGTLTGPDGATFPASAFTTYREAWYDARGLASDSEMGGQLGRYPDALIPSVDPVWGERRNAFPADVAAGENLVAWLDVLVPRGIPAGRYTGASVRVVATGYAVMLPITVNVLDADLPSTPSLASGFDLNPNRLCAAGAHSCSSYPGGSAGLVAMYERVALDNRLGIAKPPSAAPSYPADTSYRTYTRPLLMGTAPTRLAGARLQVVTIYQWAKESADEWKRLSQEDGFAGRVRFHCDEISSSHSAWTTCQNDYNRANALWKSVGTNIGDLRLQVTVSATNIAWGRANGYAALADRITTFVPVVNHIQPKDVAAFPGLRGQYTTLANAPGASREVWAYTSCMSMGCSPDIVDSHSLWNGWPSYGVDQPPSQARAFGWLAFTYDIAGEYYYETARDAPTAWTNLWSSDGGNHGDGTLFYPGTPSRIGGTHDVAIESIRLKRIRDGREDHEYLRLASAAGNRTEALAVARGLFPVMSDTTRSQAAIDAARAQLVQLVAPTRAPTETDPPLPPVTTTATCAGRTATIVGTAGSETLRGTAGADVIAGLGGNDRIEGLGGNDLICGDVGDDVLVGGTGIDSLVGGAGNDTLSLLDVPNSRDTANCGGQVGDRVFMNVLELRTFGCPLLTRLER